MVLSTDQSRLLATPRWRWLPEVVERWYAEPLAAADGADPDEVTAVASGLDRELPEVLVEWYLLVGNRLQDVQDSPATLEELPGAAYRDRPAWVGDTDGIVVWWENQGCWALLVGSDGECFVNDNGYEFGPVPLPTALHAMVLSDTLVGVWSHGDRQPEGRIGPLGQIAAGVRGGAVMDGDVPCQALCAAYAELPVPGNPYFRVPPRGDSETVLRGLEEDSPTFEWMTSSDAAFARLDKLVDLFGG
ncbi:MAG: hypothetical protein FWH11_03575 [Micrococcales bacterium]|nr:hypothetical protein [Micrococcales bacterium]